MEYKQIDAWGLFECSPFSWLCVLTNSTIKANGELVMGKGIALEATKRYPRLSKHLAGLIESSGNQVYVVPDWHIISFPTKIHWRDKASLGIIESSAIELKELISMYDMQHVILPAPGIGYGGHSWSEVVPMLDVLKGCPVTIVHRGELDDR